MSTQRSTVTLQQVADQAGVSLATASRVLNGSTRTVNAELSEHVRAVATRLRYVSHGPAQALAKSTTSLVGLLVHDVNDPYFSAVAAGAMRIAREQDLLVMVANTYRDPGLELDYITRLGAQRTRAILLAGSPPTDPEAAVALRERLTDYLRGGGRVASIGDQGPDIDAVLPENAAGARAAAAHLTELGHKRIGVIEGPRGLVTVADRLAGFREGIGAGAADIAGFSREGIAAGAANIATVEADFTREGGYEAARRLLALMPDLTAIFALSDLMAVGAMAALREAGRRVPEDVSVIGFDDLPICADLTPGLTTVRVDTEGMGEQAMRLVLTDRSEEGRSVMHSVTELVVRGSTGPA